MIKILGFDIQDLKRREYFNSLIQKYDYGQKTVVISGNPEILYNAWNHKNMKALLLKSDIIPDGIGVILAGLIYGKHFKEKIAGIEIMEDLLNTSYDKKMNIYLLGAQEEIVKKAADICKERYGAYICGFNNGYFDINNCNTIINEINEKGTDVILVAMGSPRQEDFIFNNFDKLNCKIFMGVGGSFDVIAGKINRAPKWMIKLGLEWLYRVIKEPTRIKRLISIPRFLLLVIKDRYRSKIN